MKVRLRTPLTVMLDKAGYDYNPDSGFPWGEALKYMAENPNKISEHDYKWTLSKGRHWPTCSCGQLCKKLPLDIDGSPKDQEIRNLGLLLINALREKKYEECYKLYRQIAKKVTAILNKPKAKKLIIRRKAK